MQNQKAKTLNILEMAWNLVDQYMGLLKRSGLKFHMTYKLLKKNRMHVTDSIET